MGKEICYIEKVVVVKLLAYAYVKLLKWNTSLYVLNLSTIPTKIMFTCIYSVSTLSLSMIAELTNSLLIHNSKNRSKLCNLNNFHIFMSHQQWVNIYGKTKGCKRSLLCYVQDKLTPTHTHTHSPLITDRHVWTLTPSFFYYYYYALKHRRA